MKGLFSGTGSVKPLTDGLVIVPSIRSIALRAASCNLLVLPTPSARTTKTYSLSPEVAKPASETVLRIEPVLALTKPTACGAVEWYLPINVPDSPLTGS